VASEAEGVLAADPATCTRDDDNSTIAQRRHVSPFVARCHRQILRDGSYDSADTLLASSP
jgi:hypothetical protein